MWFFDPPDESSLPERLQGLFQKARESVGFVPNVFRAYSYRPERLSAWFGHFKQLHVPTEHLDEADREMIAVVVSAWNRCTYCIVAHGHALRVALKDQVQADLIATNWRHAGLDDRRTAICAFAEKLTLRPREVEPEDVQSLRDAGLTEEEAWDVAEIASMYNLTNRMAMATGMLPNTEYHAMSR